MRPPGGERDHAFDSGHDATVREAGHEEGLQVRGRIDAGADGEADAKAPILCWNRPGEEAGRDPSAHEHVDVVRALGRKLDLDLNRAQSAGGDLEARPRRHRALGTIGADEHGAGGRSLPAGRIEVNDAVAPAGGRRPKAHAGAGFRRVREQFPLKHRAVDHQGAIGCGSYREAAAARRVECDAAEAPNDASLRGSENGQGSGADEAGARRRLFDARSSFEHEHRGPGGRGDARRDRAGRSSPDDDYVESFHGT